MNAALLFYYVMVHCMINIQGDFLKFYFRYRSVMIFLYLMLLIWVIVKLDRFAKDQLAQKLALAQKSVLPTLKSTISILSGFVVRLGPLSMIQKIF